MWPRFLRAFANLLVVAYACDALVSACDEVIGTGRLGAFRNAIAHFVVLLSVLAVPLLGLSRRLPLSVFAPLVASALWFGLGALPLGFYLSMESLVRVLTLVQVGIAGAALLRIRWLRGGQGWLFDAAWFDAHRFSPGYLLAYACVGTATIAATIVVVGGFSVAKGLETVSRGFVRFDEEGVSLAARSYVRGEKSIRLIGMIHIGQRQSYESLFADLGRASSSTVVLTEGVTDVDGLLASKLSYAPLADFLGVEEQTAIADYVELESIDDDETFEGPDFVHADVDVSRFDPVTIEWIGKTAALYSGRDPVAAFFRIYEEARRNPAAAETALEDIIELRNRFLVARLEELLPDYEEFVVPWGALHLPGIEASIEALGFERTSSTYTPLIKWRRVARAITGTQAPPVPATGWPASLPSASPTTDRSTRPD